MIRVYSALFISMVSSYIFAVNHDRKQLNHWQKIQENINLVTLKKTLIIPAKSKWGQLRLNDKIECSFRQVFAQSEGLSFENLVPLERKEFSQVLAEGTQLRSFKFKYLDVFRENFELKFRWYEKRLGSHMPTIEFITNAKRGITGEDLPEGLFHIYCTNTDFSNLEIDRFGLTSNDLVWPYVPSPLDLSELLAID